MEGQPIKLAQNACMSLALALYPIQGVNLAVSHFGNESLGKFTKTYIDYGKKPNINYLLTAGGGTPLYHATLELMEVLKERKAHRKIIFLITDGCPDSWSKKIFMTCENLNIELYGIGILQDSIKKLLPKTSIVINDIKSLPKALFDLMQKALLKNNLYK
jgi:uncharacterized protein YegL